MGPHTKNKKTMKKFNKTKSAKRLKNIPKKNSSGKFSEYDEISFDINKMLWTAYFNNKFLGNFSSEEKAHAYRFKYVLSIPIPPLKKNGRYSLHKGVDFDKIGKVWVAKSDKKVLGKYNSEKEAIEAIKKYNTKSKSKENNLNNNSEFFNEKIRDLDKLNNKQYNSTKKIDNKNIFLVDYDNEFVYVVIKCLISNYNASIFNFIDMSTINNMIWDKNKNGLFDVIINLIFTKEDYKNKLEVLLNFNFENL